MSGSPGGPSPIEPRSMTRLYILALSLVAALTLAGQFVVQLSLSTLQGDTTIVNEAGRQRMLSQRIPRLALALAAQSESGGAPSDSDATADAGARAAQSERARRELRELLNVWRANHESLSTGQLLPQRAAGNSAPVEALLAEVGPHLVRATELVQRELEREAAGQHPSLSHSEGADLVQQCDAFLDGMDRLVSQLATESRQRVARLRWIERGLLLATILVLICEGCFIFSPAVASLGRAFRRLQYVSEQLEQAKNVAENANRAKTEFLARVSHELRTPLHATLGMLSLVGHGRLSPIQRRRIEVATNAARALQRLVDDLLDIASAESGNGLHIQPSAVDVADGVNDCMRLMQPLARRKGLSLSTTVDLPGTHYMLDGYRLRQILINLLQNAIRYTAAGSVECSCRLEEDGEGKWLLIAVRDTGCGIAPHDQQRIFESFVCLEPETRGTIGGSRLGLGLPITASLVRSMHGRLTLESQPGQGSTFTIALPATPALPTTGGERTNGQRFRAGSSDPRQRGSDAPERPSPAHALVVDDARVNRLLLKAYLKRLGIAAVGASNLEHAWQLFQRHQPELILLDAHLPQEDPIAFLRRVHSFVRAQSPRAVEPRIYIVTADARFSAASLPPDVSVDGVLHKPLELEQLRDALAEARCDAHEATDVRQPDGATGDDGFAALRAQLRELLKKRLPDELDGLRSSLARGDAALLSLIAHRLNGSAANAGWVELATECSRLEAAASDTHQAAEVLRALEALVR